MTTGSPPCCTRETTSARSARNSAKGTLSTQELRPPDGADRDLGVARPPRAQPRVFRRARDERADEEAGVEQDHRSAALPLRAARRSAPTGCAQRRVRLPVMTACCWRASNAASRSPMPAAPAACRAARRRASDLDPAQRLASSSSTRFVSASTVYVVVTTCTAIPRGSGRDPISWTPSQGSIRWLVRHPRPLRGAPAAASMRTSKPRPSG
jgi:hypothetical protein